MGLHDFKLQITIFFSVILCQLLLSTDEKKPEKLFTILFVFPCKLTPITCTVKLYIFLIFVLHQLYPLKQISSF